MYCIKSQIQIPSTKRGIEITGSLVSGVLLDDDRFFFDTGDIPKKISNINSVLSLQYCSLESAYVDSDV